MTIDFVSGDRPTLQITLRNDDGSTKDLTGSTVAFKYRIDGGALVEHAMAIDADPTTGVVSYTFAPGELDLAEGVETAEMVCEYTVTDGSGKESTSLQKTIHGIRARL